MFELSREQKLDHSIPAQLVRFPLSLDRLGPEPAPRERTNVGAALPPSSSDVYLVVVWYGNTASERDRAAIASVVSSIGPG